MKISGALYSGRPWLCSLSLSNSDHSLTIIEILQFWSKGRVALVGDAGYCASPLSGQGTSLALVGAYMLAGELKAAAGDYRMAFASYEKEMREYVELNQKSGATAGKHFIPPTRIGIWLSNQMIRSLPYMPWENVILKEIRRPYDAITLKNYKA